MFILDLLVDIAFSIYTSLGFGTPQHKINTKMDKLSKKYPEVYKLYEEHKELFEGNEKLSKLILEHPIKRAEDKEQLAKKIEQFFTNYKQGVANGE